MHFTMIISFIKDQAKPEYIDMREAGTCSISHFCLKNDLSY